MTVKAKVDFINAVANGSKIPCSECGSENKPEARFCTICGNALVTPVVSEKKSVNPAVVKEEPAAVVEKPLKPIIMPKKNNETPTPQKPAAEPQAVAASGYEDKSAFANGLPAWTLEPPQVLVKRRILK